MDPWAFAYVRCYTRLSLQSCVNVKGEHADEEMNRFGLSCCARKRKRMERKKEKTFTHLANRVRKFSSGHIL